MLCNYIYDHELVFLDDEHKRAFEELTPGNLKNDREYSAPVYILTSDDILRSKTNRYIKPVNKNGQIVRRDIDWDSILSKDHGHGHYSAIYWAFALWSGHSWGGWDADEKEPGGYKPGEKVPLTDTISESYYMDGDLKFVALIATAYRWRIWRIINRFFALPNASCGAGGELD